MKEILSNPKLIDSIKRDVFTTGTVLEDLETLGKIKDERIYKELYNKVIAVDEYKNPE